MGGNEAAAAPASRTPPVTHRLRDCRDRWRDHVDPARMAATADRGDGAGHRRRARGSGVRPVAMHRPRRSGFAARRHRPQDRRDGSRRALPGGRDSGRFLRRAVPDDHRLALGWHAVVASGARPSSCCPIPWRRTNSGDCASPFVMDVLSRARPVARRPADRPAMPSRRSAHRSSAFACAPRRWRYSGTSTSGNGSVDLSSPGCVNARSGVRIGPGTTALTRRFVRLSHSSARVAASADRPAFAAA